MSDYQSEDRNLALDSVRVTEAAAISSARLMGRGDEKAADQAAVDAMRQALNVLEIDGTVVIGEGERDEAPMLYIGEKVGTGGGPKVDIALDPLEGTTITAKGGPNAISCIAMAPQGGFLNAPDTYMDKLAVGAGLPPDLIDITKPPIWNLKRLAEAKDVLIEELVVLILDRPRHQQLIADVRATGARIQLISDGDVAGVIATAREQTGIDIYMGIGGAPEGVLAAAALRCIGGQFQGRLHFRHDEERARARRMGIKDLDRIYHLEELAVGDVMFTATGVTDGTMLKGIRRIGHRLFTHSIVMRSKTGTVRVIEAEHNVHVKPGVVPHFQH
jgi:fructose-1,6-bisphosphatase II / sedoheptulose-1,7-bisphosphatase